MQKKLSMMLRAAGFLLKYMELKLSDVLEGMQYEVKWS